ncbi:MAG: nucleotide exchange factor GrpE [Prevotellaceae bacterium]|nr:nucleotide exchange factor GrpE [Candidatus Minthosoma equi]
MTKNINEENINEEIANEEVNNEVKADAAQGDNAEKAEEPKELTVEEKLAEAENQIADWKDKYLRLYAEFDNYKKQQMKVKADLIKNGGEGVIKTILPIIDDLERAQQNMAKMEDVSAVKEGVELIIDKFFKQLATEGLKKIDAVGQPFDTDFHEAIAMVPGQPEEMQGKVLDCMKAGYMLNDKVIRFAQVAVAQ